MTQKDVQRKQILRTYTPTVLYMGSDENGVHRLTGAREVLEVSGSLTKRNRDVRGGGFTL